MIAAKKFELVRYREIVEDSKQKDTSGFSRAMMTIMIMIKYGVCRSKESK